MTLRAAGAAAGRRRRASGRASWSAAASRAWPGCATLQVHAQVPGAVQPPLLLEQDVLVTDGPTVFAPGTLDAADLAQVTAFELRQQGRGAGRAVAVPGADGDVHRRGRVQAAAGLRLDADGRGGAERAAEAAAGRVRRGARGRARRQTKKGSLPLSPCGAGGEGRMTAWRRASHAASRCPPRTVR